MKIVTPESVGEMNKQMILDCVRKQGPLSRADIRRITGMSFPAVSANVKQLLDGKFLLETGEGGNVLGRKSTLIAFNAKRGYVVGADVGRSHIRVMVCDSAGDCIVSMTGSQATPKSSEKIAGELKKLVVSALKKGQIQNSQVLCISIGIPGIFDQENDEIKLAPFVESLCKKDLINIFQPEFNVPVLIENSVNHGAIGEKWKGAAREYKNILYINYGVGLGAALIINGELFRGANGASGEIGFMVLEKDNIRSSFSEQGALEQLISGNQVNKNLHRYGDDEIAIMLGMMLINVTSAFNQELIVISGGFGTFLGDHYLPRWEAMLKNHVPFPPKIVCSELLDQANVYGAIAAAIRRINSEIDSSSQRAEVNRQE
jgi:predicted NBD/HSP70 family sugar kinase